MRHGSSRPRDHLSGASHQRYAKVIRAGCADNVREPADAIEVENGSIRVVVAIVMNHPITYAARPHYWLVC